MIVSKLLAGTLGTLTLGGVVVFHQGLISVNVKEKRPGGDHVCFVVPATLVTAGLAVAPADRLRHATEKARQFLPAAGVAARELEKIPDAVLVEVIDGREHVRIEKRGGKLIIDVDSPRETVHVSVPLSAIVSAIRELESAQPGQ